MGTAGRFRPDRVRRALTGWGKITRMGNERSERAWLLQDDWDIRFEWGPTGVSSVPADAVVVIDVLRFTTAVDAGVSVGATVYPYRWKDEIMHRYAREVDAVLADPGGAMGLRCRP
jgi:hypothetical protein